MPPPPPHHHHNPPPHGPHPPFQTPVHPIYYEPTPGNPGNIPGYSPPPPHGPYPYPPDQGYVAPGPPMHPR